MVDSSNDNSTICVLRADADGQAAILLVESLIHQLIACSVISVFDAVEIVEIAAEVKEGEIAEEPGDTPSRGQSLALLEKIRASLSVDLPRK